MIRTSSVNGSAEMKDESAAMAIECLVPMEAKDWTYYIIHMEVRRDPEDDGTVQVKGFSMLQVYESQLRLIRSTEPRYKQIIRKIFNIQ